MVSILLSESACSFVDPIWPLNWDGNGAGVRPISILGTFFATKVDFSRFC
ncbi:hypothetical protein MED193_06814 [Roseobacter sp. MED193]|nr:hypothetical protein MED193_06814 [Roseobacter sp. MED193]